MPPARSNPALRLMSAAYGGVSGVVHASFTKGWRKTYALPCKVISIGNLTTGGTGKTPMVQTVCRRLQEEGYRVAVVSRGYRGTHSKAGAIVSDGNQVLLNAEEAGDEPLLHACNLKGVPVVIGRDRVAAGLRACHHFQSQVVVLDDGFQYWRLKRDHDVVLIDATDPFGGERLTPSGNLREPLSALRRATVVVLTKASRISQTERERIKERLWFYLAEEVSIFEADHQPVYLYPLIRVARLGAGDQRHPLDWLNNRNVVSACAVVDGEGFVELLASQGAKVVERFFFPDHHRFTIQDYRIVQAAAEKAGAMVMITEKDAVKWKESAISCPVYVLRINMRIKNEETFWTTIHANLG